MREKLISLALKVKGEYSLMMKCLPQLDKIKTSAYSGQVTVLGDVDYPECFYQLQYPPLVLFYKGDLSLYKEPTISIIGSRQLDEYSKTMTSRCIQFIKDDFVIVSGLAKGIDGLAHQEAKRSIGILGCGIDVIYPKQNKDLFNQVDCIISEYPPTVQPMKHHFPWRNRLIAASSEHLWVMSGVLKSGTMHTVNQASNMNVNIYCLPHPFDSKLGQGVAHTINQGAMVLTKEIINDIIKNKKGRQHEEFSDRGVSLQIENNRKIFR